jgi:histidinol-phosphate aminotransferase
MKDSFNKLVNSGILKIKPYVPGKSKSEVARENGIENPVKMASNENPLGISPKAQTAIQKVINDAYLYPEVSCYNLREALSVKFNVPEGNIIVGNGADGIIYALGMTLIEQGDEVIIPEITFSLYETISLCMRARVVFSKMKNLSIDLDDILTRITKKTKLIWLSNPNNPTGTLIKAKEFQSFIESVPDNVLVVHDEVYYDFAIQEEFPKTAELLKKSHENIFIIRSFSKIYGLAGVRLGYGIGSMELIKLMYRIRPPFDVSILAQAAGIGALSDNDFYTESLQLVKREKEYIYRELDKMGLEYIPSQTNFIIINLKKDSVKVFHALINMGWIVRPLKDYKLPHHIRITIGLREQNQKFLVSLKEAISK